MEPAGSIIDRLGGVTRVAEFVGVHRTRVSNWKRPREAGGTGGMIPQKYHLDLLAYAEREGISLSAGDFLPASIQPASQRDTPSNF